LATRGPDDSTVATIYDSAMTTPGIDEFKRRRGAVVKALPAHLRASSVLLNAIRYIDKTDYDRLLGFESFGIARFNKTIPGRV